MPRRKQPHIYSDAEITALLCEARLLLPREGLCPRTYVAFFSLLISTGLRVSEACRLTIGDIDLVDGTLTVRAGKFRKSRLVPLHPTATLALTRYAAYREQCRSTPRSEFFFRTERAPALTLAAVEKTFGRLRKRLGWTARGRARRPRIHDLRHSFAVKTLLDCYREGVAVETRLPQLSTYLGHVDPASTYWYLTGSPELLALAGQRLQRSLGESS